MPIVVLSARLYPAQLRRKLEAEPAHPVHPVTSAGLGYTLEPYHVSPVGR